MATPPTTPEVDSSAEQPDDDLERVAVARICPECGAEYELATRYCPTDGSPLRPRLDIADPLIGRIVADRYRVTRRLGEGGMGRVYLAEHVKMGRKCALKVMSARLVNDADSVRRFAREASSAARILHPNVAAVFDYGESDGLVYLVMEYVDGEPLSRVLRREGPLAPWRALAIGRQIAEALGAAHELGIIHRDLKPDNVLIAKTQGGREVVKVVDFGIAKAVTGPDSEDALTRTGLVVGTPEYMSPEQLLGDPVDARTDLYALGCIIFQMLTGALPFGAPTREQIVKRRLAEDPPRLRAIIPSLPAGVERTVATLLGRAPGARFRTALDAAHALDPAAALGPKWDPEFRPALREEPTEVLLAYAPTQRFAAVRRFSAGRLTPWITAGVLVVAIAAVLVRRAPQHTVAASADTSRTHRVTGTPARADSTHTAPESTRAVSTVAKAPGAAPASPNADSAPSRSSAQNAGVSPPHALQRPIEAYAHAMQTGDPAAVQRAYPAISSSQLDILGANFFALAEHIRARTSYRAYAITGELARVDFVLHLAYEYKTSHTPSSSATSYRATLVKDGGSWKLQNLEQR